MFIVGGPCWGLKGEIQFLTIQTPDQAQSTDVLGLLCEVCRSLLYLSIPSLLKQCHVPSHALQCLVADIAGDSVVYVLPRCCWLWQPPAGVDWWYCNFNLSALIWRVWCNLIWDPEPLSKKLLERSFILISFCYSFAFFYSLLICWLILWAHSAHQLHNLILLYHVVGDQLNRSPNPTAWIHHLSNYSLFPCRYLSLGVFIWSWIIPSIS